MDEDDVMLWDVEEEVIVEDDVVEDFVEDVADVDVVWIRTENCAWLCPVLYPALLAEANIAYCPWTEFMGRLKASTYVPDWSENTS